MSSRTNISSIVEIFFVSIGQTLAAYLSYAVIPEKLILGAIISALGGVLAFLLLRTIENVKPKKLDIKWRTIFVVITCFLSGIVGYNVFRFADGFERGILSTEIGVLICALVTAFMFYKFAKGALNIHENIDLLSYGWMKRGELSQAQKREAFIFKASIPIALLFYIGMPMLSFYGNTGMFISFLLTWTLSVFYNHPYDKE